jgi:hypothetical protein
MRKLLTLALLALALAGGVAFVGIEPAMAGGATAADQGERGSAKHARQRVERIVLPSPRSEPVRETAESCSGCWSASMAGCSGC